MTIVFLISKVKKTFQIFGQWKQSLSLFLSFSFFTLSVFHDSGKVSIFWLYQKVTYVLRVATGLGCYSCTVIWPNAANFHTVKYYDRLCLSPEVQICPLVKCEIWIPSPDNLFLVFLISLTLFLNLNTSASVKSSLSVTSSPIS